MDDELVVTDDVIFLLSTDWFSLYLISLGLWEHGGTGLATVREIARAESGLIFGGASDYFLVNFSAERTRASFQRFMASAKSGLRAEEFSRLRRIVDLILGFKTLTADQKWAAAVFAESEVSHGFPCDVKQALGADFRSFLVKKVEGFGSEDMRFPPESKWDLSMEGRFGGLPSHLEDFARARFVPSALLSEIASEISKSADQDQLKAEVADWMANGAANLRMTIDPSRLALLLSELNDQSLA